MNLIPLSLAFFFFLPFPQQYQLKLEWLMGEEERICFQDMMQRSKDVESSDNAERRFYNAKKAYHIRMRTQILHQFETSLANSSI
jgi:hypothetical protein